MRYFSFTIPITIPTGIVASAVVMLSMVAGLASVTAGQTLAIGQSNDTLPVPGAAITAPESAPGIRPDREPAKPPKLSEDLSVESTVGNSAGLSPDPPTGKSAAGKSTVVAPSTAGATSREAVSQSVAPNPAPTAGKRPRRSSGQQRPPGKITDGGVTIKVQRKGKTYFGRPLVTDGKELIIARWDGRMTRFPVGDKATKISLYSKGFKPYSTTEMKARLQKHFGSRYKISTTDHFVVIHPNNGGDAKKYWAKPFEQYYIRLRNYFTAHGYRTTDPEFPLIAIVLRSRSEFDRRLDAEADFSPTVVGYYSRKTNRITTYDPTKASSKVQRENPEHNWLYSSQTIIHEIAHQVAFNCGVHNRFSTVPKWTSEGLAMLCETRGVYDFKKFPDIQSRIHRLRLKSFRKLFEAGKTKGKLLELLQNDRLFDTDSELAYAVSWAISFYLNENRQADYMAYLKRDAKRGSFRVHNRLDRVGFFIDHFGRDIDALESRMNIFISSLK